MSLEGWTNLVGLIGLPLSIFAAGLVQAGKASNAKEHAELHGRITTLAAQLAEYRERVARDYATRDMMDQVERRLGDQLNRMDEKLDRLVEGRH